MEWSLVLADLPPRVRQEVRAMDDTINFLRNRLREVEQEREEARQVAKILARWLGSFPLAEPEDREDWLAAYSWLEEEEQG